MSATRRGTAAPVPERVARLDRLLVELGGMRHRLVYPLARAARDLEQCSGWTVFGYLTREDFARGLLGRSGRWLRDLATLQEKMEALPPLGRAVGGLDGGQPLGRVAALWIGRVASPEDVGSWISRARRMTLQRLRSAVEEAAVESPAVSPAESVEPEVEKEPFKLKDPPDIELQQAEMRDLFGAVMGRGVTSEELFEATVAEVCAGPWNPEYTPKPRRALGAVAAAPPRPDSSPLLPKPGPEPPPLPARIEPEPTTTAERKALRTLKRMMELTRDLLQASRRVQEASAANPLEPSAVNALQPSSEESALAPETTPEGIGVAACASSASRPGRVIRTQDVIRIGYQLRELVRLEDEIEIRIADLLLEMMELRAWPCLGFAGLAEYAEERLGLGRTAAHGRVRLARALRRLPVVRAAYEAGRIGMTEADWIVRYLRSAKRDALRVSDAALQEAGNSRAETTTVKRLGDERCMLQEKELEDLIVLARQVSMRRRGGPLPAGSAGAAPDAAGALGSDANGSAALGSDALGSTTELGGEVTRAGEASTNALADCASDGSAVAVASPPGVARASATQEAAAQESATHESAVRESEAQTLATRESAVRESLSPPDAAGGVGASPDAARADSLPGASLFPDDALWLAFLRREPGQARRRIFGLGYALLERVTRKWALLERPRTIRLSPDLAARLRATLAVASEDLSRRARAYVDHLSPAQEARLLPSERIALEYCRRGQPLPRWVAFLALLEECVRVWDDPAGMTRRRLDAIHNRTGWRCTAPGCTARRNLHVHHICHRSLGGTDEDWNEISICAFHHLQGEHGRYARCRGRAPLDVVWRLGVAELHLWYRNERRIRPPVELMRG